MYLIYLYLLNRFEKGISLKVSCSKPIRVLLIIVLVLTALFLILLSYNYITNNIRNPTFLLGILTGVTSTLLIMGVGRIIKILEFKKKYSKGINGKKFRSYHKNERDKPIHEFTLEVKGNKIKIINGERKYSGSNKGAKIFGEFKMDETLDSYGRGYTRDEAVEKSDGQVVEGFAFIEVHLHRNEHGTPKFYVDATYIVSKDKREERDSVPTAYVWELYTI